MPTLKTLTLGCKVNQYETEYVRAGLAQVGFRPPREGEPADVCLVNTCTVTAQSDHKSRKAIRQLARENPSAEIIVMGCYATRAPREAASLPGVVEVVTDKRELPALLARFGLLEPPAGLGAFGFRHRAYVKVQDGCRMRCSYCVIPKVRPRLQSRPVAEVLDEVRRLVDGGHREIVLVGIHLGHYGVDLPDEPRCATDGSPSGAENTVGQANRGTPRPDLAALLERLTEMEGDFRVRLSSLEASEATDRLLAIMAEHPERICPHLHLSMQSGSDAVLRRMRRPGDSGEFIERCLVVRERLDLPALTTDVIVGFPGETEADFEATCRAVETVGFAKVHVFPFSAREGTEAATLPGQIPRRVRRERAGRLAQLAQRPRRAFFESLVGRRLQVLVEGVDSDRLGVVRGTSARYAPVALPGGAELMGQLVRAVARRAEADGIEAEAASGFPACQRCATRQCATGSASALPAGDQTGTGEASGTRPVTLDLADLL